MAIHQISDVIKEFFENFERASNTFDGDLLALQFSDPFMAANPQGGIQVAKRSDLRGGTSKRQAFFQAIGFQFVKIVVLNETRLDDHYVMVKAHVRMRFEKSLENLIDIEDVTTYILFVKDASAQIVFNLTHEDLMKVMREHGLISDF